MKKVLFLIFLAAILNGCATQGQLNKAYDRGYKQAVFDSIQTPDVFEEMKKQVISENLS